MFRVGFVNLADSDANCYQCETVFKEVVESDEFASKVGSKVEVLTADSDSDIEKQTTNVETMLTQGIDMLFLIGVDTEGNSVAVEAANAEGVPVYMVATEASAGDYKFIGFSETDFGGHQGEWCANNLPAGTKICYIGGTPGREAAVMREESFMEGIEGADLEVIGNQSADFMTEDAMQVTEDFIQAYGDDIGAIVTADDKMAMGAAEALKGANMLEQVTVCGCIVQDETSSMIRDGEMDYAVYVSFKTLGELCADICADTYNGEEVDDVNNMDLHDITLDNVDEFFE